MAGAPRRVMISISTRRYFFIVVLLFLNRYLFTYCHYNYPIFLTILHMISTAFCSSIGIFVFKIVPFRRISSPKQLQKIYALSAIFGISVVCGNVSLSYLRLPLTTCTAGATTLIFTATYEFLITGSKESTYSYQTLLLVTIGMLLVGAGIVIDSPSSFHIHEFGFLMCVASASSRALKSVVQGLLLREWGSERLDSMNLLLYITPMVAVVLLPLSLYMEGNVLAKTLVRASGGDSFIVYALIGNALVAYLVNLTNFWLTKHTSCTILSLHLVVAWKMVKVQLEEELQVALKQNIEENTSVLGLFK